MLITRYLFLHQAKSIFTVLAVMLSLILIAQILEYSHRFSTMNLLSSMTLVYFKTTEQLSHFWILILTMGTLLGILRLRQTYELQALLCQALSKFKIVHYCVLPALILSLLQLITAEGVSIGRQSNSPELRFSNNSIWTPLENGYMYISSIDGEGTASGVSIWETAKSEPKIQRVQKFDSMSFRKKKWQLENGTLLDLRLISQPQIARVANNNLPPLKQLLLQQRNINDLPITQLLQYDSATDKKTQTTIFNILAKKTSQPLLLYCLTLLVCTFVFSSVRDTRSSGRMFLSSIVAVICYILFLFIELSVNVYTWNPIIIYPIFLTLLLFFSISLFKNYN